MIGSDVDGIIGSSTVRAGWATDKIPRFSLPPLMARYNDRRINRKFTFCGSDVFADGTARGQSKNAYEPGSNIVNNWDVMEGVLDYVFHKLGLEDADNSVDRPIVMTEPVANLGYARRSALRYPPCRHSVEPFLLTTMPQP